MESPPLRSVTATHVVIVLVRLLRAVRATSLPGLHHLVGSLVGTERGLDGISDDWVDGAVSLDAHDEVQVLVPLELDGVEDVYVLFVPLHALHEGFAEDKEVPVTVDDGVTWERAREPRLRGAWIEDDTAVAETGHVPVEQFRRGRDRHRPEDLGLLAWDPIVVVEVEEVREDDPGQVTEEVGRQVLLEESCDVEGRSGIVS